MNKEALFSTPRKRARITVRNRKQLQNMHYNMKKFEKPEDDLALVQAESIAHADFFPDTRIYKGKLYVTARLPEMEAHVRSLLAQKQPILCGYDTTFKCGDFWVSILVFRHPYLKEENIVPFGFLFHQSKEGCGHDEFFLEIVKRIPAMNSSLVTFVTDRELAIINAIRAAFPNANHLFCYKHMYSVS